MRKGQITLRILEVLIDLADDIAHCSSYREIAKSIHSSTKPNFKRTKKLRQRASFFKNLRQVENILYKLRKEGLISNKMGVSQILTKEGVNYLNKLKENINEKYLPKNNNYKKQKSDDDILVIFDIPEKYSIKRKWLRDALINLDYKMIQKSVWQGKNKIPNRLLTDIYQLKLYNYIHIFTIKKYGTLDKIIFLK